MATTKKKPLTQEAIEDILLDYIDDRKIVLLKGKMNSKANRDSRGYSYFYISIKYKDEIKKRLTLKKTSLILPILQKKRIIHQYYIWGSIIMPKMENLKNQKKHLNLLELNSEYF